MTIEKNDADLYQTTIDGELYEFAKWGAEESLDTLMDLGVVVGKPLGSVASAGGMRAELTENTIDLLIGGLTDNLRSNRPLVMGLFKKLTASKLFCDGKPVVADLRSGNKGIPFDLHYKDRLQTMFAVAKANLEVQYGVFFQGLGQLLPQAASKPTPDKSPKAAR